MKIGILGGTFNPPHAGHLQLARAAQQDLELDLILWVPNAQNPLKPSAEVTPGNHRLRMIQALIAEEPAMAVTDVELTREAPSYMYETLEELQAAQPGTEFWLILGADNLVRFMDWHFPDKILKIARLAVAVRPGVNRTELILKQAEPVQRRIDLIEMEPSELSSTSIRDELQRGRTEIEGLPAPVLRYIESTGLYGEQDATHRR